VTDVAVINNGGANIASLRYALERIGASSLLTCDPDELRAAPRVILPGVGAAADAMTRLRSLGLVEVITSLSQPLLGICLGMQLLFESSEESDNARLTPCLGLIPSRVTRLQGSPTHPVPHMGWNTVEPMESHPLLNQLGPSDYFYFVHGYAAPVGPWTTARASYGTDFSAVVSHRNFFGTQFHPERSAQAGSRLLKNFLELT